MFFGSAMVSGQVTQGPAEVEDSPIATDNDPLVDLGDLSRPSNTGVDLYRAWRGLSWAVIKHAGGLEWFR